MTAQKKSKYKPVETYPDKSFFVSMLTRDINLDAAILDLLDNCVDGILRIKPKSRSKKPYQGYWAEINYNADSFSISDNCGGIPWNLHDYAFRLGRPKNSEKSPPGSVGTYGIGMKRAIFKIGERCLISTKNRTDSYEVEISENWKNDITDWKFPAREASKKMKYDGTTIVVDKLDPGISSLFGQDNASFTKNIRETISTYYAFIINKGFEVRVNGKPVPALPTNLVFVENMRNKRAIRPFMFRTEIEGVKVFLAVGFTKPIPSEDDLLQEREGTKYSSLDAGWTVICNDRAVLYCDRTARTGWGETPVPKFHQQFIAIAGIVEFQCSDPSKLPTTTTKSGVNQDSVLYLEIKNKMREGMKIFTDYTYNWKDDVSKAKKDIAIGTPLNFVELKKKSESLRFTRIRSGKGEQFKPSLPKAKKGNSSEQRISFVRDIEEISSVGEFLLGDADAKPNEVGIECFERVIREIQE